MNPKFIFTSAPWRRGITLRPTHIPHEPPDHVKQVVEMVRSLSNKYVPTPSLNKVEIDLLQGQKDFRHRIRKRAKAIRLREGTVEQPARQPRSPSRAVGTPADDSDIDSWHEADHPEEPEERYGLGSDLYDTISSKPEEDSGQKRLEYFFNQLETEFVTTLSALHKEDKRSIPECDRALQDQLDALARDPTWSVVQSDKTGLWLPIRIADYVADMEGHLNCYCNEIPRSNLDRIYKDTNAIIEDIEHLCSDGEAQFLRSWCKTKKIPSVCLSMKVHKPVAANGRHPTQLIVSAHNFTQCLSKLASKSIKKSFRRASINFERHTLKNSLALKGIFESMDIDWESSTIVSLDIKDMYPQCRFRAVNTSRDSFLYYSRKKLSAVWTSSSSAWGTQLSTSKTSTMSTGSTPTQPPRSHNWRL